MSQPQQQPTLSEEDLRRKPPEMSVEDWQDQLDEERAWKKASRAAARWAGEHTPVEAYISSPVRVANPGIYKRPDVIAAEAAARVEPEHPALKELFGVTRRDLYDISQQGRRQGNTQPNLWQPKRPGASPEATLAVMTPANEQRLIDTLSEARKHPGLEEGMVPWYVMDPLYQHMERLVGPERAAKEYRDFNMSMTPFSAGSSVPTEINRGTAANMMRKRGEYDAFEKYGGLAADQRAVEGYPEILRDVNGIMGHLNQASPVRRYMETGKHGYGKDQVKIDLYSGASGVPQTGFQTSGAVPDAHFTRAIGLPDARKIPQGFNDYMGGTEYRQIGPWYRKKIAEPLGIEAVPAQALMWGTFGPQTGVKTKIGAGKLELLSKQMWERAHKLGIDPRKFRDDVLSGKAHASILGALGGAGALGYAGQDEDRERGGSVDAAMSVARSIKRAKGGKVHVGPIMGVTGGRADKVPMEVPDGSYVLTADHVSGMGEGNTLAGFHKLKKMFPKSVVAYKALKAGGPVKRGKVPIYAADGEFVICPEDIIARWGDLDAGHRVLDHWQTTERKKLIRELATLAPPAQD